MLLSYEGGLLGSILSRSKREQLSKHCEILLGTSIGCFQGGMKPKKAKNICNLNKKQIQASWLSAKNKHTVKYSETCVEKAKPSHCVQLANPENDFNSTANNFHIVPVNYNNRAYYLLLCSALNAHTLDFTSHSISPPIDTIIPNTLACKIQSNPIKLCPRCAKSYHAKFSECVQFHEQCQMLQGPKPQNLLFLLLSTCLKIRNIVQCTT